MVFSHLLCRHVCAHCGIPLRGDRSLCAVCSEKILKQSGYSSRCPRCSYPFVPEEGECSFCHLLPDNLESLVALSHFCGMHRELIYLYKSGRMKNLRYYYADLLYRRLGRDLSGSTGAGCHVIVPVPPRKGKLRKEGWDQVHLLCRTMESLYGYPIARVLERTDSLQQKSLNLENRLHHLEHAIRFKSARESSLASADSIILLDDVFTTGATLSACAVVIKKYYDTPIRAVVLCSVL